VDTALVTPATIRTAPDNNRVAMARATPVTTLTAPANRVVDNNRAVDMVAPMTPMEAVNLVLELLRAVPAMTPTAVGRKEVDNNNQVDTALVDRVHPITTTKTKVAGIHMGPANKAVDNRRMVVLAPLAIPTEEAPEVNLAMEILKVVPAMTPTAVDCRAVDNNNKAGTVMINNNKEADMVVNNKEVDMVVNKVVNRVVGMIVTIE
jgi:hypothetical protein